jgi:glycosyltransferase involved in cell wall biosynthesis
MQKREPDLITFVHFLMRPLVVSPNGTIRDTLGIMQSVAIGGAIEVPLVERVTTMVSIVMPCLNEAETLEVCIQKAKATLKNMNVSFEIVIADNGSSDGSQLIAESLGARVIEVSEKGYGAALIGGIERSLGEYVVMADADDSYDFRHIPRFIAQLENGADLVMGNRFMGGIQPGAMPFLHRYLGNPVLSFVGRLFFQAPCGDFHCGMRAFTRDAYNRMGLRSLGMEFASEMVVKAMLLQMKIEEVPTTLSPDGRSRAPHLRTWRDGWRHLRFLLLYSPRWLFVYPGILLILLGLAGTLWLAGGRRTIGSVSLDVHTMMYALMLVIIGVQASTFGVFAKIIAIREKLLPPDPKMDRFLSYFSLEAGLVVGGFLIAAGLGFSIAAVRMWSLSHFGQLNVSVVLRLVAPAVVSFAIGIHVVLSSFLLSIFGIRQRSNAR